jgi:crotonobetainyl-CoA:carnitine CoA-transferase CaiB-like acyl-CoA transferase
METSKEDQATPKAAAAVQVKKRTPLEGINVLGFETGAVGPDFSKILGELGADVIKIESSHNLDFVRLIGPDMNKIGGFNESNRNKQSFGLNLSKKKGKDIARELIKTSDILVENFRGGVMENLGFDYDKVRQIKPEIIYLSSQGFGSGGPYSDYKAYGPIVSAASGMLSVWANPDDSYPVGSNAPFPDHTASKHLVIAVLAALDYKRRTGKGQLIDLAQTDVAVSLIGEYYLDYTYNHRLQKPMGNKSPYAAPHGCYSCQGEDEWCAITVFTNEEWHGFCAAIGNPLWTKDPKFADTPGRVENVEELDRLTEEWTKTRGAKEVMESLQAKGVAAGIVQRSTDTLEDPQLKWLGAIIELDHPAAGKTSYPAIPFRMSGTSPLTSRPAPLLGQHTKEICRERLNMEEDEIRQLINEDILHTPESTQGAVKGMFD